MFQRENPHPNASVPDDLAARHRLTALRGFGTASCERATAPGRDGCARYSARIARLGTLIALALAAALAACGGSGGNAADTVAQPPLTGSQPTTAATPPPSATSIGTATVPATTTTATTTATTPQNGGATTPSQTSTSAAGATGGAQAGCPDAPGGFIRGVQARGTDCGRARDVASAWFTAVHNGAAPTSQVSAAGYACSAAMSGERASVSCTGGGGTISFTASP
jgi:hypothetical protein